MRRLLLLGLVVVTAACVANRVHYVALDHPTYATEAIVEAPRARVWAAVKAVMASHPLAVVDEAATTLTTEWSFAKSDTTREVVQLGDQVESRWVETRERITVAVATVGVGSRVAVHREVLENRRYTEGIRRYYAADHYVDSPSSTVVEHRLLEEIQRRL